MLSNQSAEVINDTLPVVEQSIKDISRRFYDQMFTAHPELLRDLFNRGNQANGSQQQALAGSIAVFARASVNHPDVPPRAMLDRIAHKHASLNITPEQYQVVYEHLFAAIGDVLGDAVTPDVANAWSEVYWTMADTLVEIENDLYRSTGASDRDTWRTYRITARHRETSDVATFQAVPADGSPAPEGKPGQYVSVQVPVSDGARQIRQYSLTNTNNGTVQFAVKRIADDPAGEVSTRLHDEVHEGDLLRISSPFGDVALADGESPVLLASAGIGTTPIVSMLNHLADTGSHRTVTAVHADSAPATHPLRADFEQLLGKLPHATGHVFYENPEPGHPVERTGYVDLRSVPVHTDSTAYLCGPLPFLRTMHSQLIDAGLSEDAIHYEVFGPDLWFE